MNALGFPSFVSPVYFSGWRLRKRQLEMSFKSSQSITLEELLPDECILNILSFVISPDNISNLHLICKHWNSLLLLDDGMIWQQLVRKYYPIMENLKKIKKSSSQLTWKEQFIQRKKMLKYNDDEEEIADSIISEYYTFPIFKPASLSSYFGFEIILWQNDIERNRFCVKPEWYLDGKRIRFTLPEDIKEKLRNGGNHSSSKENVETNSINKWGFQIYVVKEEQRVIKIDESERVKKRYLLYSGYYTSLHGFSTFDNFERFSVQSSFTCLEDKTRPPHQSFNIAKIPSVKPELIHHLSDGYCNMDIHISWDDGRTSTTMQIIDILVFLDKGLTWMNSNEKSTIMASPSLHAVPNRITKLTYHPKSLSSYSFLIDYVYGDEIESQFYNSFQDIHHSSDLQQNASLLNFSIPSKCRKMVPLSIECFNYDETYMKVVVFAIDNSTGKMAKLLQAIPGGYDQDETGRLHLLMDWYTDFDAFAVSKYFPSARRYNTNYDSLVTYSHPSPCVTGKIFNDSVSFELQLSLQWHYLQRDEATDSNSIACIDFSPLEITTFLEKGLSW